MLPDSIGFFGHRPSTPLEASLAAFLDQLAARLVGQVTAVLTEAIERGDTAPPWLRTQAAAAEYLAMPKTAFAALLRHQLVRGYRVGRCWYFNTRELDEDMRNLPADAL